MIARHQKNLTTVLVVDEAHHLSPDVLEEIRLLTNLETPQEKLLQILLVGQPELDEKLDSVDLRQLKQRIALRSHLGALNLEETRGYIYCRLQLAGNANPGAAVSDGHNPRSSPAVARVSSADQHAVRERPDSRIRKAVTRAYRPRSSRKSPPTSGLNVEYSPTAGRAIAGRCLPAEVERAARTLLDLYTHLRNAQDSGVGLRMAVGAGARKNEPYI